MAEAAVGAIIEVLAEKLLTHAEEKISLIRHFKDDLETLKDSFSTVKDLLHDAEKKKVTEKTVKRWLRDLEDLAFDADNVMDDIDYELLSKKVKPSSLNKKVKEKVQSCFSCCSPIPYRLEMGRRIKVVNERLDKINQRATAFGLHKSLASSQDRLDAYENREQNAFAKDPIFVGREKEVLEIVEMLITSSPAGHKSSAILPIVGMGGKGKTTIAREIYHDENIKSHFGDNRVWVYVSGNFDVLNILKSILTSFTGEKSELATQQDILKKLQQHLGAKKYLLVLDDVWNDNREVWDGFVNSLSGISSANGYCMIVTTRSEDVASIVKTTLPVHKLKGLSEVDCWSIIKANAFRGGNVPLDFEEIGKIIAKKCQGLPLAAKVVGGLLSSMKSRDEWMSIEKSWLLNRGDENPISNVLKLSFDHLSSPSLKKCFAYCSIFPKGYEIEKDRLVELWMAEGFLQTNINMETTGIKNFSFLLRNSLLQHVRSDDYGNVTHCSMHDLVHDLACSVLCENDDVTEGVCKRRYIGYEPSGDGLSSIPQGQRYVRTLFCKVSNIKFFDDFESLHTLTLVGYGINDLPASIKKLKHLRYLDISETGIRSLPDSIGELYHLQTLRAKKILKHISLEKLPGSLSCSISLRHLHISDDTTLPPEIGKLTSLQTLPYFHVGSEKGCEISELGNLKYLKGELEIRNLEKVCDKDEAMSAGLIQKLGIYEIKLVWDRSREGDEANDESVLEGLQPHPNLKKIEIQGFKGKSLPMWTSKMAVQLDDHCWKGLNNLMEIRLAGCSEVEELPMLGQLRNLKSLKLSSLTNVKAIRPSFYGIDNCENNVAVFPALERLELDYMTNLKEWDDLPSGLVVFPRLQILYITSCKQLMRAPSHFPCLEELRIASMESGLPLENICGMKLTSLTHLKIERIYELECLPDWLFSNNHNLKKVNIWGCRKMTHLVPLILGGRGGGPSLRELEISGCSSLRELPDDLHSLNSLETLHIFESPDLKSIPYPSSKGGGGGHESQQQGFTSLRKLEIVSCPGLTNLSIEMVGSCALSLERLSLRGLSSLTNTSQVIGCLQISTTLRELELTGMLHWECLPDQIQHLTSLQKLLLKECPNLKSIQYPSSRGGHESQQQQGFTSLKELRIEDCAGLTNFPIEMLEPCATSLETLSLEGLSNLTNISEVIGCLHKMTRLTSLNIRQVPKFSICSGIQMCSSLKHLQMGPSSSSDSDCSWNNVSFNETFDALFLLQPSQISTTLGVLNLEGMEHWECLPDQIQHLTSLQRLTLYRFGIEALPEWFGNLSSLWELTLYSCKKLRHFPSKQAMQRLSKLGILWIYSCPLLLKDEGSNNDEGPQIDDSEWPKISHIRSIHLDSYHSYSHTLTSTKYALNLPTLTTSLRFTDDFGSTH